MPTKLTSKHGWLASYAFALAAVGVGFLLRLGLTALVGEGLPTYITFYPVIMAVALLGGFGPGLVATLATALAVDYWLLPPTNGFGIASPVDAVGLAFFTGMGVFMSVIAELYRRARQKAAGHDTDLLRRAGPELARRAIVETVLLVGGMVVSLAILGGAGWQVYRNVAATAQADRWVSHAYVVDDKLDELFSTLEDMEASERGYLVMGEEDYLQPYNLAKRTVAAQLAALERLTADNPDQARRLKGIEALVEAKLTELKEVIEVRRSQGLEAARARLAAEKDRTLTEEIRQRMTEAEDEEARSLQARTAARDASLRNTLQALLAGGLLGLLLLTTIFLFLTLENRRRRRAEAELRRHQEGLQATVAARTADLNQANESMRESERQFRTLADSIPNLAWWANADGYITWYNRRWFEYTGTTPEQMEGWGWQSVHDPQALPAVMERWKASLATGAPFDMTFPLRGADGVFRPFLTRAIPLKDAEGHVLQWFGTNTDVSEQRKAEEAHARLAAIVESSDDAILAKDLGGNITSWNAGAERLFGYRAEEIIGRSIRLLLPPDRQEDEDQIMARLQAGERVDHFETVRLTKDGRSLAVSVTVSPLRDGANRIIGASKIVHDITALKQAAEAERRLSAELRQRLAELQAANEAVRASRQAALSLTEDAIQARHEAERVNAELRKLNRTLQAHSESDQALVRARNEAEYLAAVCRIVVEDCGHAMVWVGFAEADEGKTVRPAAQAGFEEGYLETLQVSWADTERGRGPTGTAIRTGQPNLCRDVRDDPRFAPWRAEAVQRGYASSLVLPLLAEGRAFGALTIYSRERDGFTKDEVRLLTDLADDLAYGIAALRLRAAKTKAEEALRQSEERYRGLVELSPEAVYVNRDNRIVLVNPAALQLFGASRAEQLLGKSPFELFHPDCHAKIRERIGKVMAGQQAPVLEEKILRLDGVAVDVEVVGSPVMDQGERAVLVLVRDITERKRATQRTELLAETASRLLAAASPQDVIEGLCHKVLAFLDCQVFFNFLLDEGAGRLRLSACAGISPEAASEIKWLELGSAVCGCAARDGCCIVVEDILHTEDPRTKLVKSLGVQAYACHPLIVQGRVLGTLSFGARARPRFKAEELALMMAVADQVAIALERQRAQEALRQTAEDLQCSNRDLEQFAYVASHDLQEPLRAVGGYVKLLQHRFPDKLDAKARDYVAGAFEGATRMERLISDLLAYSRVGTRGGDFAIADLNLALGQAVENLATGIQAAQAKVTHDALPALSVDATQMTQLFQNLIGNALKYRGEQPPEIHIGAQRREGRWVFSVRDNGLGIEPQYYEKIFQIFQRLHTRKDYPGTGMGLAICKRIVERHGGTIWVESQPGQGSTFFFSIPEATAK